MKINPSLKYLLENSSFSRPSQVPRMVPPRVGFNGSKRRRVAAPGLVTFAVPHVPSVTNPRLQNKRPVPSVPSAAQNPKAESKQINR